MVHFRLRSIVVVGLCATGLAPSVTAAQAVPQDAASAEQYLSDFDALWTYVRDHYAYLPQKQTDWDCVRAHYRPRAAEVVNSREFIGLLESVLGELYDPHAHLGTNTAASPRMIPTGTDLWAEWLSEGPVITDIRAGSHAEEAGLHPGMEILAVGGKPIREAVRDRLPRCLRSPDPAAIDWALQAVLAGRHASPVQLDVRVGTGRRSFEFQPGGATEANALLQSSVLSEDVGYIRIHNSLGNTRLIAAFDSALEEVRHSRGLVLDLRDTPSGGNTTVARGIMGRMIADEQPYQRHELPWEEREFGVRRLWTEYAAPRGPFTYRAPVVVLVGRWTGSMGEGLAIGLDGMGRATVVGRPMAGLVGALHETRLRNTGFVVRVPAERLFHIDGTPREAFVPRALPGAGSSGTDTALDAAIDVLQRHIQASGP